MQLPSPWGEIAAQPTEEAAQPIREIAAQLVEEAASSQKRLKRLLRRRLGKKQPKILLLSLEVLSCFCFA